MATSIAIPKIVSAFPTNSQEVHVRKDGDDSNGDGSHNNPFKSVTKALASITDASTSKPYSIHIGMGNYDEAALALKANVYLVGCGGLEEIGCRINVTGAGNLVTLDPSFNSGSGGRAGIKNIGFKGSTGLNADMTATGNSGPAILIMHNVGFNGAVTFKSNNTGDGIEWYLGECFGLLSLVGGNTGQFFDLLLIGDVSITDSAVSATQTTFQGVETGTVTISTTNSGKNSLAQFIGSSVNVISMTQGAGTTLNVVVDAVSYPATTMTLNSGSLTKTTDVRSLSWAVASTATAAGTTVLNGGSKAVQVFTGSTTQAVTLPAANIFGSGVGAYFVIKNMSSGDVTINRAGSDTIDGGTSVVLTGGLKQSVTVVSDGTSAWEII